MLNHDELNCLICFGLDMSWESLMPIKWTGLSRLTTDEKLQEAFSSFGQLVEGLILSLLLSNLQFYEHLSQSATWWHCLNICTAKVITDRATGRSKGFGFVTYSTIEEAEKAREGMNAKFLDGWVIFVDPAKPREPRPPPQPQSETSEFGIRTNKTIGWCGWLLAKYTTSHSIW